MCALRRGGGGPIFSTNEKECTMGQKGIASKLVEQKIRICKLRKDGKLDKEKAAKYLASLAKRVNGLREVTVMQEDEFNGLSDAAEYMGTQLGCRVVVEKESESKSPRAYRAAPLKPSLDIAF